MEMCEDIHAGSFFYKVMRNMVFYSSAFANAIQSRNGMSFLPFSGVFELLKHNEV